MNDLTIQDGGALLERVIVQGDLSKLTPTERVVYYKQVCESAGLNPLTKPLEFITLNGKLVLYALRAATDQLRAKHGVSITILTREKIDDTYLVTARATLPTGRTDEAMGAVNLKGLTGDALANAYLKCETKAKRRVTLSICGLGMLDETEVDSIPGARITPSAGVEDRLNPEQIEKVKAIAERMHGWITNEGSIGDAVYDMENSALDADEMVYLWTMFDSKQRSAMKKEQARMKATHAVTSPVGGNMNTIAAPVATQAFPPVASAVKGLGLPSASDTRPSDLSGQQGAAPIIELISPAAHKRLEARISELKLDREAVKKYVKDTFGRDHFTEMTKEEYDKLDKTIEIRAAAKERKDKLAQSATEEEGP